MDDETEDGPSWAWDFAQPAEHGLSMLVHQRADTGEQIPGTTLFVASTDKEDRAMDIVKQDWRLKNFRANPVILDNHDHRRVVGSAVSVLVPKTGDDAGQLMIRVGWDLDSPDPSIRNVGHQHEKRIRNAGSVGFRHSKKTLRSKLAPDSLYYKAPVKVETWWGETEMSGFLYEGNELLEFSSATVPMNADALQRSIVGLRRADELPADAPDDRANPTDVLEFMRDQARRGEVLDLVWPDVVARIRDLLAPDEPDAEGVDEEPIAEMAFRKIWIPKIRSMLRTDIDTQRIVRALLDVGPRRSATPPNRGDGLDFLFHEES